MNLFGAAVVYICRAFDPQPDITTFELATIVQQTVGYKSGAEINFTVDQWDYVSRTPLARHFKECKK